MVSSSANSVVLNTTVGLDVGYLLYESASVRSVITSINSNTNTVEVNDELTWAVGAVSAYKCINCQLEYAVEHFKNPGVMKHFQEVALLFRETNFISGLLSFFTDLSGGYADSTISGDFGSSAWGLFEWGSGAWGGVSRPKPVRVFVPREKSRGTLLSPKLTIAQAYAKWSLNGLTVYYDWVSERTGRS